LPHIAHTYLHAPVSSVKSSASGRVSVTSARGTEEFDHVVIATHSDQSLRMLKDSTTAEQQILSAVKYQPIAPYCIPTLAFCRRTAKPGPPGITECEWKRNRVCVHYLINQLQPLPFTTRHRQSESD
jgi:predicted NAD/FAD-binding protein